MNDITQYPSPLPTETSERGGKGVAVFIQDQTTGVLDVAFLNQLSTHTLATDTVVDSRTITLTAGHGLTTVTNAGDILEIADPASGSFFMQCAIITVTGDVILLDCPVNRIYLSASAQVAVSEPDASVDGSVTPVVYSVLPFSAQKGDMVRMIVTILDNADMDFETFGGIAALTNGCVLRVNNGDGTFRNLNNFKTNGDIIDQAFDHNFFENRGGSARGFTSRLTWGGPSKHGVVVRLDGTLGESLELVIQDDLTGLTQLHWTCQGSEIQD